MADRKAVVLKITADAGAGNQDFYFSTLPVANSGGIPIDPRIANEPIFRKGFGLWLWNTRSESRVSDVDLVNADGGIDDFALAVVRDKVAELYVGDADKDFSTFSMVSALTIDRFVLGARGRVRVVFIDEASKLNETLQTEFWEATVPNSNIEGQVIPFAFGLVYQVPAQVWDPVNLRYAFTHEKGGPGSVIPSSNGAEALSTQYEVDEYGFQFLITPAGKVTATGYAKQKSSGFSSSDFGVGYPTSGMWNTGTNENLLSYTSSKPDGYTLYNHSVTASPQRIIEQFNSSSCRVRNEGIGSAYNQNLAPSIGREVGLVKWRWYTLRIEILEGSGLLNWINDIKIATGQSADLGSGGSGVSSDYVVHESQTLEQSTAGGLTLNYYFQASGPAFEVFFGGPADAGTTATEFRLNNLRIWDVVTGDAAQVDTAIPYLLSGTGVSFSSSDLSALNAEIGTHQIGYFYQRPTTVERAILDALDPFLAYYYFDQASVCRFGRLTAPDEANVQIEALFGSGTWTVPEYVNEIDVLVVGGGGGGGAYITGSQQGGGGGGGAGELVFLGRVAADQISEGASFGDSIAYSVGSGGAGGFVSAGFQGGSPGGNTTFGDLTARGGGAGEGCNPDRTDYDPKSLDGGSGGGSAGDNFNTGTRRPGGSSTASDGVGFAGGRGTSAFSNAAGGSGGGAGAAGKDATSFSGFPGGDGLDYSTIFGTGVGDGGAFAGGGCGGGIGDIDGSLGGGGGAISQAGQNAVSSTGSGGGGGAFSQDAGDGAGGIIVLRYAKPTIALEINETNMIRGKEPRVRPDLMPGLSDSFGAKKNFYPIDEAAADAGTTIEERSVLAADYRVVSRGEDGDLDDFYSWAHDQRVVDTSIQTESAVDSARQYLVEKVANRRRYFIEVSAFIDRDQDLNPGDYVFLTFDGYDLEKGRTCLVVEVSRRYRGTRADLVLWR